MKFILSKSCVVAAIIFCGILVLAHSTERDSRASSRRLRQRNRARNLREKTLVRRSFVTRTWPNAVIPYVFNDDFPASGRSNFAQTAEKLARRTCIRFRERQPQDQQWLRFKYTGREGCAGTEGGRVFPTNPDNYNGQELSMSDHCMTLSVFEHELGHTMGFPHEQNRPDRDKYITWDTKKPGCHAAEDQTVGGYAKMDQAGVDIFYDYVSLMQDWGQCMHAKLSGPITFGGSNEGEANTYSVLDYEKINAVYDCGGCQGYRFRNIVHLSYNQYPVIVGPDADRGSIFICRRYHEGSILIGKAKPDDDKCFIGVGDNEFEYKEDFEVLTNPKRINLNWVRRPDDFSIPGNAIMGGRTVDRKPVYIGRCTINSGGTQLRIPGSLYEGRRELEVPERGVQKCSDYEILVCNQ